MATITIADDKAAIIKRTLCDELPLSLSVPFFVVLSLIFDVSEATVFAAVVYSVEPVSVLPVVNLFESVD